MNKKDVIFIATTLMLSPHKLSSPTNQASTDKLKSWYLDWYQFLSEVYDECQSDSQS